MTTTISIDELPEVTQGTSAALAPVSEGLAVMPVMVRALLLLCDRAERAALDDPNVVTSARACRRLARIALDQLQMPESTDVATAMLTGIALADALRELEDYMSGDPLKLFNAYAARETLERGQAVANAKRAQAADHEARKDFARFVERARISDRAESAQLKEYVKRSDASAKRKARVKTLQKAGKLTHAQK